VSGGVAGDPDDVLVPVSVVPRAARNEIVGMQGDALKIRVTAPPVDGAANAALIAVLAEVLGIPRSQLAIRSGHNSRRKVVRITGVDRPRVEASIAAVCAARNRRT